MQFWVEDDEDLTLGVELDAEPDAVDLTQDALGSTILDVAVEACLVAVWSGRNPATSEPWPPLAPATVAERRRLGWNADIGYRTGNMLAPWRFRDGPRVIAKRLATWTYDARGCDYARYFHADRPLIGWSVEAIEQAQTLIAAFAAAVPAAEPGP
jgi:hypothetical protein